MSPFRTETDASESSSSLCREVSDEIVLEHVRAGNTALYEVLVLRYNPYLRRMARRVLSNEADVDDVIQEAHFNAFRAIKQFEGKSSFRTWLTRIAVHAALSRLRRPERRRELHVEHDPLETVVSVQRNPEQQLQDRETMETLEAAVRCLPEPYRTAFFLHWVRDLSTAQLAVSLEITESCAKTRLYRARRLLFGLLRNGWRSAAGCPAG